MATPEGKVKEVVSSYLRSLPNCWYRMVVPNGYGRPLLDYVGAYRGHAFAIETKAPGEDPTPRQEVTIDELREAGTPVFLIDSPSDLDDFRMWINEH